MNRSRWSLLCSLHLIHVILFSLDPSSAYAYVVRECKRRNHRPVGRSLSSSSPAAVGSVASRKAPHGCDTTALTVASRNVDTKEDPSLVILPDYLITDSVDLVDRPSLALFLQQPQNILALLLVSLGGGLSILNVVGQYDSTYIALQQCSVALALLRANADVQAVRLIATRSATATVNTDPRYNVSPNSRCGCSDDAVVHIYAATYTMACAWLALRTSVASPVVVTLLVPWDGIVGPTATVIFVLSLAVPAATILHHYQMVNATIPLRLLVQVVRQEPLQQPQPDDSNDVANPGPLLLVSPPLPTLTSIELFRAQSLLAIGIIGCIFAPEAATFCLYGQDWWERVCDMYRGQAWIESTNALFGVYATQLAMVAHRAGKQGVATYLSIVPVFTALVVILTVVPSACSLYWWGDQISFFDFYAL